MKLLLGLTLVVLVNGQTFLEFLDHIQHHSSFQRLSHEEKLLFGELVVAAEEGSATLESFIDRVGFLEVVRLMDHMSQYDAIKFEAYLAEHLNYTHHAPENQDVASSRKRDEHEHMHQPPPPPPPERAEDHDNNWLQFSQYLQSLEHHYYETLPALERQTYYGLTEAAEHGNVSAYIDSVGYGAIFGLMEYMDYQHANELYDLLEKGLVASGTAQKRDDHRFDEYLAGLHSQYYQHLPDEEKATFNSLMSAAESQTVTCYIDSAGYGAVFGLMEHLDYMHANQVYNFIEQHLQSETAVCP